MPDSHVTKSSQQIGIALKGPHVCEEEEQFQLCRQVMAGAKAGVVLQAQGTHAADIARCGLWIVAATQ